MVSNDVSSSRNASIFATVCNVGGPSAAEVAQLYLGYPLAAGEPPKVLKGFVKVFIRSSTCERVDFPLSASELSVWNVSRQSWQLYPGHYAVMIGSSSRDIRLNGTLTVSALRDIDYTSTDCSSSPSSATYSCSFSSSSSLSSSPSRPPTLSTGVSATTTVIASFVSPSVNPRDSSNEVITQQPSLSSLPVAHDLSMQTDPRSWYSDLSLGPYQVPALFSVLGALSFAMLLRWRWRR